ncbi:MAG: hypothetical protein U0324_12510 [Polyangiales bacterium]
MIDRNRTILYGMATLAGAVLLSLGPRLGYQSADSFLTAQGGRMAVNNYEAVLHGYVDAYRWAGAVLFAIGLYRVSER